MKKLFLKVCIFLAAVNLSAMGIGPQLDFSINFDNKVSENAGISCSIKTDNQPFVIGVATDYNYIENIFDAYITCDYWIFNPAIGNYSYFFAGAGIMAGSSIKSANVTFNAAPRIITGINWIFYDGFLEYFIQAALQPEIQLGKKSNMLLTVPVNAGIRLYF